MTVTSEQFRADTGSLCSKCLFNTTKRGKVYRMVSLLLGVFLTVTGWVAQWNAQHEAWFYANERVLGHQPQWEHPYGML